MSLKPAVGWRDKHTHTLVSIPPAPPKGATRPASGHHHPNGSPLSPSDRVASDNRHAPVYVKGDRLERWVPDNDPVKAARHQGGVHQVWGRRGWVDEPAPKIKGVDRSSTFGQGEAVRGGGGSGGASPSDASTGPSAKDIDMTHQALGVPSLGAESVNFAPGKP